MLLPHVSVMAPRLFTPIVLRPLPYAPRASYAPWLAPRARLTPLVLRSARVLRPLSYAPRASYAPCLTPCARLTPLVLRSTRVLRPLSCVPCVFVSPMHLTTRVSYASCFLHPLSYAPCALCSLCPPCVLRPLCLTPVLANMIAFLNRGSCV